MQSSPKSKGQDSVFCGGPCNTWLHHRCTGLFCTSLNFRQPLLLYLNLAQTEALKKTVEKLSFDLLAGDSTLANISDNTYVSHNDAAQQVTSHIPSSNTP